MTSPVWHTTRVFERNRDSDKRIIINRGGTRSSKTYSLLQLFAIDLMTGQNKTLSIVRKVMTDLRSGAMREFTELMQESGYYPFLKHNKTENTFTYGTNMLEFFGLENEGRVRGRKRTRLLIDEADQITYDEFRQLALRTEDKIFLAFNPSDPNIWINTELEQKRSATEGDVDLIVSTYKDNYKLPDYIVREIEILRDTDQFYWDVFGLGQYGAIKGVVFDKWEVCNDIPPSATFIAHGLDFGFTNDPTAMLAVYKQDGKLWVDELIYERGLTNQDICSRLTELSITRQADIVADSAEPKSIEEIYRGGFNIKPALKGKDSINMSIDSLRQYPLMITARSINLIGELKTYKWKVDKNGNTLNEPVDYNNHAIDALRYVALNKLNSKRSGVYHIR